MVVQRSIIGTSLTIYSAWEPGEPFGRHHTITTVDGQWFGRVGARRHECALPRGAERTAWYQAQWRQEEAEAYAAILAEYPELADRPHKRYMGEITVHN